MTKYWLLEISPSDCLVSWMGRVRPQGGFGSDSPKAVKGSGVDRAGTGLVSSRLRDYLTAHTMLWDLM